MAINIQDILVQFAVITIFCLWAYSAFRKQSIKDTIDQLKDFISNLNE